MNGYQTWRQRLRDNRLNMSITQRQLAALTGLSEATLRGYERGRRQPRREHLVKILDVLKIERVQRNAILADAGFAPDGMRLRPQDPDLYYTIEEAEAEVSRYNWPAFVINEYAEVIVANEIAQRLWGVDLRREFTNPIERNLLSVASSRRFADRCVSWDETVGMIAAAWKGHHRGPEQLENPSPYFSAVMEHFLKGDPKYITRFLTLFEKVEPATGKIRWSYPVVWDEPGVGKMRFHCFASAANEEDGLSFQDWIPLDAETWNNLVQACSEQEG